MGIFHSIKIKNRFISWMLVLFLVSLGTSNVSAEGTDSTPRLASLIEEALKSNPEIKAARELWKAAQKRIPQASALPDPTAGYAVMGPSIETSNGPIMGSYDFEQMVPFPGKLVGRRNAAKAEAAAAEARMKTVEREIIFKVAE